MRRTILTTATVALVALLAGCAGSQAVAGQGASSYSPKPLLDEAQQSAAAASSSAAAASASSALAAASASQAAAAAASSAAAAQPRVYTGSGDSVIKIDKPGDSICLATITGNKASRFFAVQGVDGDKDLLVNTTDPYSGTTLLDVHGGGTTELQVSAKGPWSITLAPINSAPELTSGSNSGIGDAVLKYVGGTGIAAITGNKGGRFFAVSEYTDSGSDVLVNTTDVYSGSVPLSAGPALVEIQAIGSWSINVS
jgi:hypothetical protein